METTETIELPLSGVHSEHCALIVDGGLDKIKGIKNHRVELNNEKAVITLDTALTPVGEVIQTIRNLGYDVPSVKKEFPVQGMSCASCAVSVESILKSTRGVLDASVNFATNTVLIEFLPGQENFVAWKAAVQSIGYDINIDEESGKDYQEEIHQEQYKSLVHKTVWSIALSIPVVIIGMFFMHLPYGNWIMMALSAPVVFWFGGSFFVNSWKQARHGKANMDTLVALSTGIAFTFSAFNTIYPEFWINKGLDPHVYFEAAAVVVAFILLGKMLEERAKSNTSSAIKKLMGLQPKKVTIVQEGGHEAQIPIAEVQVGNILVVRPGEKVPVDGELTEGSSIVDESMISGEPIPVQKEKGASVYAGTINQKGSFQMKAEKVGGETILAQIIKMIKEAQGSKAPVQKLVDKIAGIFVPIVILISIISFIIWTIWGGDNAVTHALLAMVTVLVIACPCALGLATPTAIMVGVGKGAENGILIKDAESLETAHKVNALILDKTGTITEGKPAVTDFKWCEGIEDTEYLGSVLYSIEQRSEHPLADAITNYLKTGNTQPLLIENFESHTGYGVSAVYKDETYWVGTQRLLDQNQIIGCSDLDAYASQWEGEAKTVVYFAKGKRVLAAIGIADKIKETSKEAILHLMNAGIDVYMLTGDNEETARAVSEQVGLTHYRAGVLPSDKAQFVKELQAKGKIVGMVGDGINDSQALAQANLSIAMGKGSDIAMDVAKMTLISSDLNLIPKALRLSHLTVNAIKQNLFWAFVYNLIGIPIAAGILYPFTGFLLNPMIAGAAMALSSVSVVTNSLRLRTKKL